MKKIIAVLVLTAMVKVASAMPPMHGGGFRGGFYPRTTVVVGGGFYSPYFSPFGFYGYPYGAPYAVAPYQPTKLDIQVANIRNDYADKIESVKLDKDLTGKERRSQIRTFKRDRDQAVLEAKRNYYKS